MALETLPQWLLNDVPLYAFLVALLTNPYTWSDKVTKLASKYIGSRLGTGNKKKSNDTAN